MMGGGGYDSTAGDVVAGPASYRSGDSSNGYGYDASPNTWTPAHPLLAQQPAEAAHPANSFTELNEASVVLVPPGDESVIDLS